MGAESRSANSRQASEKASIVGLRARIWVACLAGGSIAGGGIWWVIATFSSAGGALETTWLMAALSAAAGAGSVVGLLAAWWLDRGIVRHLRGLIRSLKTGRVSDLRGLPAAGGWGELSALTDQIQVLLAYQRQALRAAEELGALRRQLAGMQESVQGWVLHERWAELAVEPGAIAPLSEWLNQAVRRQEELREQHHEVALQVREDLDRAQAEGRGSREQAERAFVEATAQLTVVRELQRLIADLEATLSTARSAAQAAGSAGREDWRSHVRAAIQELIDGSARSVESLGRGMLRVQGIADQVQVLGNRATLVALNSAMLSSPGKRSASELEDLTREMKNLAREVRAATDQASSLVSQVNAEAAQAARLMAEVRERVARRFEEARPEAKQPEETWATAAEETDRTLERMREMVQDAGQKGERLVSSAERTSRSADHSLRALEESLRELEGLLARLQQPSEAASSPQAQEPAPPVDQPGPPEAQGNLRLLTPDDVSPLDDDDVAGDRR